MNIELHRKKIIENLTHIERIIQVTNKSGYFDINVDMENFCAKLLNKVYGYRFFNANTIEKNAHFVDLFDEDNRLSIQVTSDNSADKIKNTIKGFLKDELYEKYDNLKFFMIAGKLNTQIHFDTQGKFDFNNKKDILDFEDISRDINKLEEIETINGIAEYIDSYVKESGILIDFQELKEKYKKIYYNQVVENFIERKVYSHDETSYNRIYLNEALNQSKKVILLSDAGFGKSEALKDFCHEINEGIEDNCAFYFNLNIYENEKIEELKPQIYSDVPNDKITFILDGFDEIEDNCKNTFVKKLEVFSSENSNTKILLSSRHNFYKYYVGGDGKVDKSTKFINYFDIYELVPFTEEDEKNLLEANGIFPLDFYDEVKKKGLKNLVENPFFLVETINLYNNNIDLPEKSEFLRQIIEEDYRKALRKYRFDGHEIHNVKEIDFYRILQFIALILACLGRNYISQEELDLIIKNEENQKILSYSSVWKKTKGNYYGFTHNNFREWLAAESIKEFEFSDIKKLITYKKNPERIRETWLNTVYFLMKNYQKEGFINWILVAKPECIFFLEKTDIEEEKMYTFFKNIFEQYEKKEIFIPDFLNMHTNLFENIHSNAVVEYLTEKVKANSHYTTVNNALFILYHFQDLLIEKVEVKNALIEMCQSSNYRSYEKEQALKVLGKNSLIDNKTLHEIIEKNKESEDAYLRTGYFYCVRYLEVDKNNISILLDRIEVISDRFNREEGEPINLSEIYEYEKAFAFIIDAETFKKTISYIKGNGRTYLLNEFSEEFTENLCSSFIKLYDYNPDILDSMIEFYILTDSNFYKNNLNIILKAFDSKNLRLDLFQRYLVNKKNRLSYNEDILINEECLQWLNKAYSEGMYSNEVVNEVLWFSNTNLKGYAELNSKYKERTSIDILKDRKQREIKEVKPENSEQVFFDAIFSKDTFLDLFHEFLRYIGKESISYNEVESLGYNDFHDNEKFFRMEKFLMTFENYKKIDQEAILKMNWDHFIITYTYTMLDQNKDLKVNEEQKNMLRKICLNLLNEYNFKDPITYKYSKNSGISETTSWYYIYLWYFKQCFNFKYPEPVLLNMLEFEHFKKDYTKGGINYIEKDIGKHKVKKRIIENLKNKIFYNQVLENHIEYCLKLKFKKMSSYLEKYLFDQKIKSYNKRIIIKYMVFDLGGKVFIENYMDKLSKVDLETHFLCLEIIDETCSNEVKLYLKSKINRVRREDKVLTYCKYLIRNRDFNGLLKYYEFLLEKMENKDRDFRKALSCVDDIKYLDIISSLYILTFSPDFKDSKFHSAHSGCQEAFEAIALNGHYKEVVEKLASLIDENQDIEQIGFLNTIIETITYKYYEQSEEKVSLDEIISKVEMLKEKYEN